MAQEQDGNEATTIDAAKAPARRGRVVLAIAVIVLAAFGVIWAMRKDIADNVIASQLESLGLPARYDVVSIGPSQQVVRNLVIGDPARPDLTVQELRVATRLFWGWPGIGRITVIKPRLNGTFRNGRPSFGSLDKVLFAGKGEPFTMPDLDLAVVDGRALVDSDLGRLGVRLEGAGPLRDGFAGELAILAPDLAAGGCTAGRTTLYGKLTTASLRPRFVGPLRTRQLACSNGAAALAEAAVQVDLTLDERLDGGNGSLGFRTGPGRYAGNRLGAAAGTSAFAYRNRAINARYDLHARDVITTQARFARLSFEGRARSTGGFARFDVEGDLGGKGMAMGGAVERALAEAEQAGRGTLLAPLAAQVRGAFAREARGSTLAVNLIVRRTAEGTSLVVPRGALRGGSGASLLTLSRAQVLFGMQGIPHVTGNFSTGGQGMPQISGRMESSGVGRLAMRVAMPEYVAGSTRLAVPGLTLVHGRDGALTFTGQARLTGDLPGGRAENLVLPIEGRWAANGDLSAWPRCTRLAFDRLSFANLALERRSLPVCPPAGAAIVRSRGGELLVNAGIPALDLAGRLGGTPIRIASGPVGYAQQGSRPGLLRARTLKVDLGPADAASHFAITDIEARVSGDVAGTFGGADIALYAVPLDLRNTAGSWRYAGGVLGINGAGFTLVDRERVARFNPLVARDAALRLAGGLITAQALLREPVSDREVTRADIVHDLATASGHATLAIGGLRFDDRLQADTLSDLALGVVSNLQGSVRGSGRVAWDGKGVTSRGRFSTDALAFAAPFGPVKGLSGEVVFTDLLGMVTAPGQTLRLASINPGIEVVDGMLSFEMRPGHVLQVNGASWPFMGGTLTLDPARMQIGIAETRRYTLRVNALDASTFVRHLEMENLNATGVFDGQLPLVFDENGGRIEDGRLVSRPPGGNVAYVGELTYKDLSPMGNFAFDTLKSVDYKRMEISMGGTLAGEIITRVSFNGISQGAGARRNFLTRQVAKLPIRFVLNVKAPFFSLFAPLRSLYDPSYVIDPRTLGFAGTGAVVHKDTSGTVIQPPVSETRP